MNLKMCIVFICSILVFLLGSHAVHAQANLSIEQLQIDTSNIPELQKSWWQTILSYIGLKSNTGKLIPIGTTLHVVSSAYAPSKYQTDATPCITAAGTTVRPGVVATNFLPLGTIVSISSKKYIVEDRMNPRYRGYYMDIWFPSTSEALEFGRRRLDIVIVAYGKPGDVIATPTPSPLAQANNDTTKSVWNTVADSVLFIEQFLVSKVDPNHYDVTCSQ